MLIDGSAPTTGTPFLGTKEILAADFPDRSWGMFASRAQGYEGVLETGVWASSGDPASWRVWGRFPRDLAALVTAEEIALVSFTAEGPSLWAKWLQEDVPFFSLDEVQSVRLHEGYLQLQGQNGFLGFDFAADETSYGVSPGKFSGVTPEALAEATITPDPVLYLRGGSMRTSEGRHWLTHLVGADQDTVRVRYRDLLPGDQGLELFGQVELPSSRVVRGTHWLQDGSLLIVHAPATAPSGPNSDWKVQWMPAQELTFWEGTELDLPGNLPAGDTGAVFAEGPGVLYLGIHDVVYRARLDTSGPLQGARPWRLWAHPKVPLTDPGVEAVGRIDPCQRITGISVSPGSAAVLADLLPAQGGGTLLSVFDGQLTYPVWRRWYRAGAAVLGSTGARNVEGSSIRLGVTRSPAFGRPAKGGA